MAVAVPDKILHNRYITIEDAVNDVASYYYEHYNTVLTIDDIYFCIERSVKKELFYILNSLKEKNIPVVENSQTIFIDEDGINIYYFVYRANGQIDVAKFDQISAKRIRHMIVAFSEYLSQMIDNKLLMPEAHNVLRQNITVGTIDDDPVDNKVVVSVKSGDYIIKGIMYKNDQVPNEMKFYKKGNQMYFYVKRIIKTHGAPILVLSRSSKSLVNHLLWQFSKEEQQNYIKRWSAKPKIVTVKRFFDAKNNTMRSIVWSNVIFKVNTLQTVSKLLNNEGIRIRKLF